MSNSDPTKPGVVRQAPTPATYQRSAIVGGTVLSANIVKPIIAYLFSILVFFAPGIPVPADDVLWAVATVACAGGAFWASFALRGTRATQRADDRDDGGV